MQTTERRATRRPSVTEARQGQANGEMRAHEHEREPLRVVVVGVVLANLLVSALESGSPRATRRRLTTPRPVHALKPST
jgi:hypothetical protein